MQNTTWGQKIEYLALLASAVGTGIAAVTQQATYATTPLILALFLNIFNRQHTQTLYVQETKREIVKLDQQLQSLTASVDQS